MKTSTQLAVQTVQTIQTTAAKPKVSKAEAIKAAVARARAQHETKQEEHAAAVEAFNERMKTAALQHLIKEIKAGEVTDPEVAVENDYGSNLGNVKVSFSLPAGSFGAFLRENKKLDAARPGYFRSDEVKREIKLKLDNTQDRIALILADEENVRVIDALLASLKAK